MATTNKSLLANRAQAAQTAAVGQTSLGVMIGQRSVQERFEKMLGKKSAGFLSSLLSLTNNNKLLRNADPRTVLAAAATAASLDLPINQSLGKAWIVPYKGVAQFNLGYKGAIELAQRSGRMKKIICLPVREGELEFDPFDETFKRGERVSEVVVGYFASFELLNGFKKSTYWTKDEVIKHAKRFSKAFNSGPWQTDFDAMACKTVLMSILKTYAPMSIEMQQAFEAEGQVQTLNENGQIEEMDVLDVEVESGDTAENASDAAESDVISQAEESIADGFMEAQEGK